MIKNHILLVLLFCFATANAQNTSTAPALASVEKSLFNVQVGAIGFYVSNEARISNRWALRTELGLDMWFYETYNWNSYGDSKKGAILAPSIGLEPRWYYNLKKRAGKGKNIENNSASFVTLAIKYYSDAFKIGGPDGLYIPNQVSFVPKWGIRRAIAKSNFNYELGIGIGPIWYLDKTRNYKDQYDITADVHIRLGYTFK